MIDGQNVFDQPVKKDMRIYGYTTGCLLYNPYFK